MPRGGTWPALRAILLCGFVVVSQHLATDGSFWWRHEGGVRSAEDCRTLLKRITGRPKVGFTKWYDVSPQMLAEAFGVPPTPEKGTWIACWPEGTTLGEPDS